MISQKEVKSIFDYNAVTGDLIRLIKTGHASILGPCRTKSRYGYYVATINYKKYLVHRLIWLWVYGWLPEQLDHINHNRTANQLSNLRVGSSDINNRNKSLDRRNVSGTHGVTRYRKAWRVFIGVNKKQVYLGIFARLSEAIKCRKTAETKYGYHKNHGGPE